MDTLERGISGRRMVLFLSAGKAFTEKEICFAVGENYTLQIPAEELHLTESFFSLPEAEGRGSPGDERENSRRRKSVYIADRSR